MRMSKCEGWHVLPLSGSEELDLELTLGSGQAFLWRQTGEGEWTGPIENRYKFTAIK